MSQELAIILKSFFPYKKKLSILSRSSGKGSIILLNQGIKKYSPGIYIAYDLVKNMHVHAVQQVTVLKVPVFKQKEDLYWIHHLLEICYYFLSLDEPSVDIFRLIRYCLEFQEKSEVFGSNFSIVKKICLMKLLILIGFYPQRLGAHFERLFDYVLSLFLDSLNDQKVRSLHILLNDVVKGEIKYIDAWLLQCIREHPSVMQFKTIPFFYSE